MSPLSEKLENGLLLHEPNARFSAGKVLKEGARGAAIALRNLTKELFYTLMLFVVSFIPGLALVTTPLIYLVQSYYAGFGNMDYYLERHYSIRNSVYFVRQYRWAAITNGALFLLLLLIPIVGLFLAPFMCTIAATVVSVDRNYE